MKPVIYEKAVLDYLKSSDYREDNNLPQLDKHLSPLRYPGGKSKLSNFLSVFLTFNGLQGCTLIEPFCGGAGASLPLLKAEVVDKLILNDSNSKLIKFWDAVLHNTDELTALIKRSTVSIEDWHYHRRVYNDEISASDLEQGFAAFFLNRTNRSGMLHAGPIGGRHQKSEYKLDCRFNKRDLINRIEDVSLLKDKIKLSNQDACELIKNCSENNAFIYADPPYVKEGKNIYHRFCFTEEQHTLLSQTLKESDMLWLVSYDDNPLIHQLFAKRGINIVEFNYAISRAKVGRELLIASNGLDLPHIKQSTTSSEQSLPNEKVSQLY